MKTFIPLISIVFFTFISSLQAQDSCKVLVRNLQGSYIGDCKNGLAHGKGTANGIDTYVGSFKKGYPNGIGRYVWSTGAIYEGKWKKGVRNGEGNFTYKENGKVIVQNGVWINDKYKLPKRIPPQVIRKDNISSVSFTRLSDGNQVNIKMIQNGMLQTVFYDFNTASSGIMNNSGSVAYYQNISFPFTCKIEYYIWNSAHAYQYKCTLEFVIPQSGNWELRVDN